eukprot:m.56323 g.56323  ORF g.56323 m.56323 type:complete len:234 (-) comp15700_c0_seq1:27-728(-)
MATREDVHELLRSMERYNPKNLDLLVTYAKDTVEQGGYDIEAYLAILKLFQFNPSKYDEDTTRTILLKALAAMPDNDFTLCLYLLTDAQQESIPIAQLVYLHKLLETCMFSEFWTFLNEHASLLDCTVHVESEDSDELVAVPLSLRSFPDAIRNYIAHVVTITYQELSQDLLASMLHLNVSEVPAFAEARSWKVQDSGVVFVANQEDHVKSKNIVENIQLKSLTRMMAASYKL